MSTVVVPDAVLMPGEAPDVPAWDEHCPHCGSNWADGPEGSAWGRQHCYKCGFNPNSLSAATGVPWNQLQNLVADAIHAAMSSVAQQLAVANTAALGREGMANLAADEQARVGFGQGTAGQTPQTGP